MKRSVVSILLFFLISFTNNSLADAFFSIDKVEYYKTQVRKGPELYKDIPTSDNTGKPAITKQKVYVPCLSVKVKTADSVRWTSTKAIAYFYDKNKKLIETVKAPSLNTGQIKNPIFSPKNSWMELIFAVPESVVKMNDSDWTVAVIFGDNQSVSTKIWPLTPVGGLEYPEKQLTGKTEPAGRKATMDPVVEQIVKTGNPKCEQITLLMRPPKGITEGKDVNGVMAMCILANSPEEVREYLQGRNAGHNGGWKIRYALDFADKNKLAVIAWGTRRLWDPSKNWDELDPKTNKEMDQTFDDVAKAWSKGVGNFVEKYGIPEKNYLLWGISGSAQFACRLALRKPDYFLAIHAHIPDSFDRPTIEANRILWCLTTGELEAGYERSQRFYAKCRELGYPMIYKAVIGLGHEGSTLADNLGLKFFQYALSIRSQRDAYDAKLKDTLLQKQAAKQDIPLQPWLESFRSPEFVGDIVNQELFPASQVDQVPAGFRVSLPTKEIADAWNKK